LSVVDAPERPPIDPRLRARRIAVRREEGRRRLRRLGIVATIAAVVLAAGALSQSRLLDVDRISVDGAAHTPPEEVRAATGIDIHEPMVRVDLGRARHGVLALPWVATVSVKRSWPATIHVRITERTPVATVPAGAAGFALVDAEGRVLQTSATPPPGVVVLSGVPAPGAPGTTLPPEAADALHVASALPPNLAPKVSSIVVGPAGVELRLVAGGTVRLGPATDLVAKLVAADTVLTQADVSHLCVLDVRVASAPSLTQGERCA